jgi:alpha-1,2-mannosyltransferase
VTSSAGTPAWLNSAAALLTRRRLRAHAIILALCLWGACAVDFLTPGVFDRAANIKFQDFLSFYVSGELIARGQPADLYNEPLRHKEMLAIAPPPDVVHESWFPPTAHTPLNVHIPNLYGPQVAVLFVPFAHLPFLIAAQIWAALNLVMYFLCIYAVWRHCDKLRAHATTTALAAAASPPLFHFFVRGQLSVLVLVCFTGAFAAVEANRPWLAGIVLGLLIFKPQFLVAIPLILLFAQAWKMFLGLLVSAAAQLALARVYFGAAVMHSYFDMLLEAPRWIGDAELQLAPIQMHSLRSFWTLLIPSPAVVLGLYFLSSLVVIAIAAAIWKSQLSWALKFSALTLAAVLANPHLLVYDLVVLAPAFLLVTNWTLQRENYAATAAVRVLLFLAFVLPLFGPISHWTHVQLSVPVFAAVLWLLYGSYNAHNMRVAVRSMAVGEEQPARGGVPNPD